LRLVGLLDAELVENRHQYQSHNQPDGDVLNDIVQCPVP
jgi:hypothetical protein